MLLAYMNLPGSAVKMLLKFHHIQKSSAVISVKFFQLGCGLVKRLVGLGRFELDHPALQCFFVLHFYFVLILKRVPPSPDWLHWTFDWVQILLPFNYSLLHLLLFFPGDDFAGFFSWSWHDRHRRAPAWEYYANWNSISGSRHVQPAKLPIKIFQHVHFYHTRALHACQQNVIFVPLSWKNIQILARIWGKSLLTNVFIDLTVWWISLWSLSWTVSLF